MNEHKSRTEGVVRLGERKIYILDLSADIILQSGERYCHEFLDKYFENLKTA